MAVDPGRDKCGVAVCEPGRVIAHRVIRLVDLAGVAGEWVTAYAVDLVIVGNSTGAGDARARLAHLHVPVDLADERGTTLEARHRYFTDHPPRGWRRIVPRSLQVPPEPYDDYAAILIAESFLTGERR
jgi:RNase H-fold protein (predicted Holliday junction resolvase)